MLSPNVIWEKDNTGEYPDGYIQSRHYLMHINYCLGSIQEHQDGFTALRYARYPSDSDFEVTCETLDEAKDALIQSLD